MVIATGARYRRLDVAGLEAFEGTRFIIGPRRWRRDLCSGQEVVLVGGGNSAGQAVGLPRQPAPGG